MSMAKGAPGLDLAGAGSCLRTSRTNSILFRPPFILPLLLFWIRDRIERGETNLN